MKSILMFLGVGALMFTMCLWGTVLGAVVGWTVGLVFDGTMRLLSQALGIDAAPYQLGAMFGFIGGFFRASLEVKKGQSGRV